MYAEKAEYNMGQSIEGYEKATAMRRPTQIEDQGDNLEKAITSLEGTAERLEACLSKVLRDEAVAKDEGYPEECLVPLANNLRGMGKRVSWVERSLQSVIDRLEL